MRCPPKSDTEDDIDGVALLLLLLLFLVGLGRAGATVHEKSESPESSMRDVISLVGRSG